MQRNFLFVAALAVVLAVAKSGGEDPPGARERQGEGARRADDETMAADRAAEGAQLGAGERLLRELGADERAGGPPLELSIAIATLPDPLASNVDWMFDSHLDSLRRAFERESWVLERFALPWNDATEVPHEPGALLFRKRGALTIVYVVGEVSTGGVDPAAFESAVLERCGLVGAPCGKHAELNATLGVRVVEPTELRVVGPVFSGTCHSLREALDRNRAHLAGVTKVSVVSGAATGDANAKTLVRARANDAPEISFRSTLHTDGTLMRTLEQRVLPRLGLAPADVAILREGSTEYGQRVAPEPSNGAGSPPPELARPGMLVVPFPMSIGTLRQAYQRSGKAVASEVPLPGRTTSSNLPLELEDRPLLSETPLATSALTPPSVDLLLEETTRTLAQHGIRAVLLFATDVRDKLFLGSELKRRLPDLQLLTTEGNVLYLWPELNRWLRGMVVVSTYPLLLRDPTWVPQSASRQPLLFANEGAQGTFNATLAQLGSRRLADYAPIFPSEASMPPVWVTVVGAGTMLPLGAFDVDELDAPPRDAPEPPVRLVEALAPAPMDGMRSERGFVGTAALCVLAFALAFVFFRAWRAAHRGETPFERMLARGAAPHGAEGPAQRIALARQHELYTLCYLAALWSIVLPSLPLLLHMAWRAGPDPEAAPVWIALFLCTLAVALGAVVLGRRANGFRRMPWRTFPGYIDLGRRVEEPTAAQKAKWFAERVARLLLFFFGLGFVACTLLLSARLALLAWRAKGDADFLLLVHRALEFDQGLSFLLPIALIGAILSVWCGWHRKRLEALARAEPAEWAFDDVLDDQPAARVRRRLFRTVPDWRGVLLFVPGAFVLVWLGLRVGRPLDEVALGWGGWRSAFDVLLRVGLVAPIAASAWSFLRLLSLWGATSRLLARLDPYTATLPFDEVAPSTPALRRSLLPSDPSELERVAREQWAALLASREPRSAGVAAALSDQNLSLAALARRDVDGVPLPQLVTALRGLLIESRTTGAFAEGEGPLVRRVIAAEVLLYVEWILQHVRRLASFLVVAMLLTTALVWSYSFQPQHLVQNVSLLVFAAAIGVLLWLIVALHRDPALGRIASAKQNGVEWDRDFVVSLVLFGLAPVVTMLTTNAPELREQLSKVLEPILRALTTG